MASKDTFLRGGVSVEEATSKLNELIAEGKVIINPKSIRNRSAEDFLLMPRMWTDRVRSTIQYLFENSFPLVANNYQTPRSMLPHLQTQLYERYVVDLISLVSRIDLYVRPNCTPAKSAGAFFVSTATKSTSRRPKLTICPDVFDVPNEKIDPKLVAVMMPFEGNFTKVYGTLQSACTTVELTCKRADEIWSNSKVMDDIFLLLMTSRIIIADFSGKNANVFYEAGIAHTLGKHLIPITQSDDDIPFDLKSHRYIKYLNNAEGLVGLEKELVKRLKTLSK